MGRTTPSSAAAQSYTSVATQHSAARRLRSSRYATVSFSAPLVLAVWRAGQHLRCFPSVECASGSSRVRVTRWTTDTGGGYRSPETIRVAIDHMATGRHRTRTAAAKMRQQRTSPSTNFL